MRTEQKGGGGWFFRPSWCGFTLLLKENAPAFEQKVEGNAFVITDRRSESSRAGDDLYGAEREALSSAQVYTRRAVKVLRESCQGELFQERDAVATFDICVFSQSWVR